MLIICPDLGQPFYGQDAQHSINPPSYTKLDANGNRLPESASTWFMVRDNITGLIWEVKTNDSSIHDRDNDYSWQDAQDIFIGELNSLGFGGFGDWRLPSLHELSRIANKARNNPCIDTSYFMNVMTSDYWTSTLDAANADNAWYVVFLYGYESSYSMATPYYVMAVRGEQTSHEFMDNGDGTVSDIGTGLMWQQDSVGGKNWEEALACCDNLTLAGYNDWRLPNFNELQSLADYEGYDPAIDTTFFENTEPAWYWSSTTRTDYQGYAWCIDFYDGQAGNGLKLNPYHVRAVRAGQCGPYGDSDNDTVCDDGDNSGDPNDNPCSQGMAGICDDNCIDDSNPDQADSDDDMIGDACDNCPATPNGPHRGSCVREVGGVVARTGLTCTDNATCGTGRYCQMEQGDCNFNTIGDACECYADVNADSKVALADLVVLKIEFGRTDCLANPCQADTNDDNKINLSDLVVLKSEFGRTKCPVIP